MLLSIFTAISCKKAITPSTPQKPDIHSVASTDGPSFLSFATFEDYDGYISNAENTSLPEAPDDFISLRSIIDELEYQKENDEEAYESNPHIADSIYESYGKLLDVLNEDKIVNLFGYLVRVDVNADKVYTINATTATAYDLLINNPTSSEVTAYSTEEDVTSILAGLSRGGCGENPATKKKNGDNSYCSSNKRTTHEVTYQSVGIYFSLVAEVKGQKRDFVLWLAWYERPYVELYMNMEYKERCGTNYGWYQGWAHNWSQSQFAYKITNNKVTFRPYERATSLTTFNFGASIHSCGSPHWHQIVH